MDCLVWSRQGEGSRVKYWIFQAVALGDWTGLCSPNSQKSSPGKCFNDQSTKKRNQSDDTKMMKTKNDAKSDDDNSEKGGRHCHTYWMDRPLKDAVVLGTEHGNDGMSGRP
jgi:hypothetical protein